MIALKSDQSAFEKVPGIGAQPCMIAISSNAKRAYVTNYADGTVSVIDIAP